MPPPQAGQTDPAPKKDKKNLSPEDRRMHVQLALLSLAVMIDVLGFSIIIPLVPEYVQHALHISAGAARTDPRIGEYGGWLTAVYALMQFLFAPAWGRLSDRIGRRPILIGSLVGDAVFYALFGLSTHSLAGQFAARILAGIFSSASLSVAQAYAADITPPHLRAMGLGYLGAAFGVGFILGPAFGGLIGHFAGLSWPLFFSSLLALVNVYYIARFLPEPARPEAARAAGPPASFFGRLHLMARAVGGPVGFLYALTFLVTFAFANLEGTFTAYLKQHFAGIHDPVTVAGGVFAYVGLLIVLIQGGAIRPLVKRYGEANLVVTGVGLMAAGLPLLPPGPVPVSPSDRPDAAAGGRQRAERPGPARPDLAQVRRDRPGGESGPVRLVRQPGAGDRPGHRRLPVPPFWADVPLLVRRGGDVGGVRLRPGPPSGDERGSTHDG